MAYNADNQHPLVTQNTHTHTHTHSFKYEHASFTHTALKFKCGVIMGDNHNV